MIAAFAPATVSNVGCGFDVLGFALDAPGDVVVAEARERPGVEIARIEGDGGRLSRDPETNTAGAAVHGAAAAAGRGERRSACTIHKGLPLASGVGSSGASAVAALVAVNELLGRPAPLDVLLNARCRRGRRLRLRAPRQCRAVALWRLRAGALARIPPESIRLPVPDGAGMRGAAPAYRGGDRAPRGRCSATQFRCATPSASGATSARWWPDCFFNDLRWSRARSRITWPNRGARISCPASPRSSEPRWPPARWAAACPGRARRSLRSAPRSTRPSAPARQCATAFAESTGWPADLWISPVGTRGARIVTG